MPDPLELLYWFALANAWFWAVQYILSWDEKSTSRQTDIPWWVSAVVALTLLRTGARYSKKDEES